MKTLIVLLLLTTPSYAQLAKVTPRNDLIISCSYLSDVHNRELFAKAEKEKERFKERVEALIQIYDYVGQILDLCKVKR